MSRVIVYNYNNLEEEPTIIYVDDWKFDHSWGGFFNDAASLNEQVETDGNNLTIWGVNRVLSKPACDKIADSG